MDDSMDPVVWLKDVGKEDLSVVGGKGASLGEMINIGVPVPGGFAVTAQAFRDFINRAGIAKRLFEALDVDVNQEKELHKAEEAAKKLIMDAKVPEDIERAIKFRYEELCKQEGKQVFVAVRSSATAEDLPDASFAGQQETYLNMRGAEDVFNAVRRCWASLYGARAIFYRVEQGFEHDKVNLSAIVQMMVDSEKSGVMFSSQPSTGEPLVVIEAAWGLGESVVSGSVSPDNFVVDRKTKKILSKYIATKEIMIMRDPKTQKTVTIKVPADKKEAVVLTDNEAVELAKYAEILEKHYGIPQDIEWGVEKNKIYILQSRPITTINNSKKSGASAQASGKVLLNGLGAAPGVATGIVRLISTGRDLDKVKPGDIMVTKMTMPDMVPGMKRAGAIVTDEGGMACHAAIVSRELGCPAVVGTKKATSVLKDGVEITVDGGKGIVYEGRVALSAPAKPASAASAGGVVFTKPMTATEIKVNVSEPDRAEAAAAT
ncbi:MAG: pyruvate, water dikinase, partial [Euryarchaeota archaeon]|nr:pyruvate, water dikinase [Euryarchaeota archaeon]